MKQQTENHLWFVAVVSTVLGFIGGVAWTDPYHQAKWLFDYQTLIAGAAAVVAAFLTINAMRQTDQQQQERHEELLRLNLRADRLRARRAAFPAADEIATCVPELAEHYNRLMDEGIDDHEHAIQSRALYNVFESAASSFGYANVSDAKDMFGSQMSFTYYTLREIVLDCERTRMGMQSYINQIGVRPSNAEVRFYIRQAGRAVPHFEEFAMQLRQLAAHYGPD